MSESNAAYGLRVTLMNVEPEVTRYLIARNTITLANLHLALQITMGWANCHLHSFESDGIRYGLKDPDFDDGLVDQRRRTIKQLVSDPGRSVVYEYDFGDGWLHEITLLDVFQIDNPDLLLPMCVDGVGACPPEDVGGPHGYKEFLEALADESHSRHDEFVEWIGGAFDPDFFDIHSTNVQLGKYVARAI